MLDEVSSTELLCVVRSARAQDSSTVREQMSDDTAVLRSRVFRLNVKDPPIMSDSIIESKQWRGLSVHARLPSRQILNLAQLWRAEALISCADEPERLHIPGTSLRVRSGAWPRTLTAYAERILSKSLANSDRHRGRTESRER